MRHYHDIAETLEQNAEQTVWSWETIRDTLEQRTEHRTQFLKDQKQEIQDKLEYREQTHQKIIEVLNNELDKQNQLIDKNSAAVEPDSEMRDRITELKQELAAEHRNRFSDKLPLWKQKMEIEDELEKLEAQTTDLFPDNSD